MGSLHEIPTYHGHFGLSKEPLPHAAIGGFFYEGAGRGPILDALIYALVHGEGREGIIKVTGAIGAGKTALCQALRERLPHQIKVVYLNESALFENKFLSAFAAELREGWETEGKSATEKGAASDTDASIEEIQDLFVEKHASGKQVVLLVDEAQGASAETLKLVMKLHDSQLTHFKLLQVVLFGRAELDDILSSRQMHDFRQSISHQFVLQPLNTDNVEDYLMRRMYAADYRGPPVFSTQAVQLIASASNGLIASLDRLARKSLEAAGEVSSPTVEVQHVRMSARGARVDLQPKRRNLDARSILLNTGRAVSVFSLVTVVVAVGVHNWQLTRPRPPNLVGKPVSLPQGLAPDPFQEPVVALPLPLIPVLATDAAGTGVSPLTPDAPPGTGAAQDKKPSEKAAIASLQPMPAEQGKKSASSQAEPSRGEKQQRKSQIYIAGIDLAEYDLLRQRIEATARALATRDPYSYTIQLYATDNIHPDRMERFLSRAKKLVDLSNIYIYLINDDDNARFRVAYGIYATREEANAGIAALPEKYKSAFETELYTLAELS